MSISNGYHIDQRTITASFSKALYPKEAVLKASYCFIDRCYIHLSQTDADYCVELSEKETMSPDILMNEFKNELLAQSVRYHVYKQTHVIREVLMARAMASTIVDSCHVHDTNGTDPNLEDIIQDWFDRHGNE